MTTYIYTDGGTVDSSAFEAVYYDADMKTLYLVFNNGNVAAYERIESSTYKAFVESDSLGRFYNQYVQGAFPGVSVDQDAEFAKAEPAVVASDSTSKQTFEVHYTYSGVADVTADSVEAAKALMEDGTDGLVKVNKIKVVVEFE